MSFANTEQADYWSQRAPTWLEMEEQLEDVIGPPGQLAMDRLSLLPKQRVIDLGCGAGRTTVELATRVSPGGEVLGLDIADAMLGAARERAEHMGVENVEFVHADVQVHDFGTNRFDAAFSRFGVMFFSDPVAAFSNVRNAIRPGGLLSFVCWQSVFDNEWMLVPGMAAMSVIGALPQPRPEEPGPFSLCDPDRVRSILCTAGFSEVEVLPHNDAMVIAQNRIPEAALMSTSVGAIREALQEVDNDIRKRVLGAIEEALRERVANGVVRASRGVLLVSGTA